MMICEILFRTSYIHDSYSRCFCLFTLVLVPLSELLLAVQSGYGTIFCKIWSQVFLLIPLSSVQHVDLDAMSRQFGRLGKKARSILVQYQYILEVWQVVRCCETRQVCILMDNWLVDYWELFSQKPKADSLVRVHNTWVNASSRYVTYNWTCRQNWG